MAASNDSKWQKDAADQNFDYMFKLLIIGNSSVGKTSFLFRYADDSFTSAFVSTVGIDFKVKTVFRQDKRVKLQIWVSDQTDACFECYHLFSATQPYHSSHLRAATKLYYSPVSHYLTLPFTSLPLPNPTIYQSPTTQPYYSLDSCYQPYCSPDSHLTLPFTSLPLPNPTIYRITQFYHLPYYPILPFTRLPSLTIYQTIQPDHLPDYPTLPFTTLPNHTIHTIIKEYAIRVTPAVHLPILLHFLWLTTTVQPAIFQVHWY